MDDEVSPISTEHTLEQAAELLRQSDFGGECPFAFRYSPGNGTSYELAIAQIPYNAAGATGPWLLVAVLGTGSWAFRLADDAPMPDYIHEKINSTWFRYADACALHVLIAAALGRPAACSLADAGIRSEAA